MHVLLYPSTRVGRDIGKLGEILPLLFDLHPGETENILKKYYNFNLECQHSGIYHHNEGYILRCI